MELKLIIFDVDGTLYDLKSHCIPQSCTEAIRQLKRNKIRFAIASGRAHYGMGKALNDLRADYIIADSGGVIVDSEGNMLYHEDMPFAECCQLLEFARQEEAGLVFKFPQHMYIYQHPEKVDWLQGQMNSDIGSEPFIRNKTAITWSCLSAPASMPILKGSRRSLSTARCRSASFLNMGSMLLHRA